MVRCLAELEEGDWREENGVDGLFSDLHSG